MSFAQKEWPGRGRILMAGISTTNAESPERKLLSGGVALISGGGAIAQRLAWLGPSVAICGRDRAAHANSDEAIGKSGSSVFSTVADVALSAMVVRVGPCVAEQSTPSN
jgi:NAD(P)-dependent dehydrogenase (short-subunit alcohol dehydrogenase family)